MARRIYVASSWRNQLQPAVVVSLREGGHAVYDFRNPQVDYPNRNPRARGFQWSEIDPEWRSWQPRTYVGALDDPIAVDGYESDWEAMQWADTCVLVLPCGRSSHLEAGYFVGARKDLFILLGHLDPIEPELMYRMATRVCIGLDELLPALISELVA